MFNSRGLPIDPLHTNNVISTNAIYIIDGKGSFYAITVTLSGYVTVWRYVSTSTPPWIAL